MPTGSAGHQALLAGLLALLLPGCVTRALWSDSTTKVTAMQRSELHVAALGTWNDEAADPGVVLAIDPLGNHTAPAPDPLDLPQLLLFPNDAPTCDAIVALLATEPLGPLDRRVVEVDWTRSRLGEVFATAHVDLIGEVRPGILLRLDDTTAAALLGSPRAVPRERLLAGDHRVYVEAAERVDWRLLMPFDPSGRGAVLAGIPRDGAGDERMDLLVRVGDDHRSEVVRVPASLTPILGSLHRDSLLFDRYRLQATCRATLSFQKVSVAYAAPKHLTKLALTSAVESLEPSISLPMQVLLTPFAVTADVLLWVLRHGPVPLEAFRAPENPNVGPVQSTKSERDRD